MTETRGNLEANNSGSSYEMQDRLVTYKPREVAEDTVPAVDFFIDFGEITFGLLNYSVCGTLL